MADSIKARRDWMVERVPTDGFVERDKLISVSAYEHGLTRRFTEEDLEVLLDIGKLVKIVAVGSDFAEVVQIWRPGPSYEEARRKEREKEGNEEARRTESRRLDRLPFEIFKKAEGPARSPVERIAFKAVLIKAGLTDNEAERSIRALFREGLIYESKPGWIRRLGA